jgi:hypothetical protein
MLVEKEVRGLLTGNKAGLMSLSKWWAIGVDA